jgi:hypothetical protein
MAEVDICMFMDVLLIPKVKPKGRQRGEVIFRFDMSRLVGKVV